MERGPGKHSSCSAEDGEALGEQRKETVVKSLLKNPWLGDSGGKMTLLDHTLGNPEQALSDYT